MRLLLPVAMRLAALWCVSSTTRHHLIGKKTSTHIEIWSGGRTPIGRKLTCGDAGHLCGGALGQIQQCCWPLLKADQNLRGVLPVYAYRHRLCAHLHLRNLHAQPQISPIIRHESVYSGVAHLVSLVKGCLVWLSKAACTSAKHAAGGAQGYRA